MSQLRRLLMANQTREYTGYPLVISRSVALRYLKQYQMYGNSEQGVPAGYTPLEYIESTGTQAISTGIDGTNRTLNWKIKAENLSSSTNTALLSCGLAETVRNAYGIFIISNTWSTNSTGSVSATGTQELDATININTSGNTSTTITVDNVLSSSYSRAYDGSHNMRDTILFASKSSATAFASFGKFKVYYAECYEGSVMIANFIPAKRNSDSVIGMYDTVSGRFFTNAGTRTFTAGPVLPTPENPVEVISVGDRTKNLFDKDNVVLGYSMNEDGTLFATVGDAVSDFIRVKPNTTYYLTRTGSRRGKFFTEDKQPVQTATFDFATATSGTSFTTGSTTYYVRFASSKFADYKDTIQLEEGSVATSYVPYGYQIPVFAGGGGVVDLGTLSWTYRSDLGTGVFTTPFLGYDKEVGNINLFISGYTTVNKSGTGLNNMEACGHGTTPRIYVRNTDYTDPALLKESLQGKYIYYQRTTDASWTAPTTTPIYLNAPLRKVGNYADVLDYKNGQIIRNVGVKVLDGTEEWSSQTAGACSLKKSSLVNPKLPADSTDLLCTHFVAVSSSVAIGDIWVGNNYINFFYDNSTEHLAEFKTWLAQQYTAGTPVTMYYILVTPVTESIVAPALPTMAGSTTYTTETVVKPSNMKGVF